MKAGDKVTIMHNCIAPDGKIIHERDDQVIILGIEGETVLLVGFKGTYFSSSFYENYIGQKVTKKSVSGKRKKLRQPKPFKSRSKVNTIKGVITHPELGIPAYTFEEDESYVECRRCKILNPIEVKELTK